MKKIAALLIGVWVVPGAATAKRPNDLLKTTLVKAGRVLDVRAGAYALSEMPEFRFDEIQIEEVRGRLPPQGWPANNVASKDVFPGRPI